MTFTGAIYRPPLEYKTPLLQVTVGCAHNKCTFCTMYREEIFHIEDLKQIEDDIKEIRDTHEHVSRVFLVNGDAFVLSAKRLLAISELLHRYLPELEVISMYASISNIRNKTDEELSTLKETGINDLWVGVETGDAETLDMMNKGHNLDEAYRELERLNEVGIRHLHGLIVGASGKGKGLESARETAKLLNRTKPSLIWICSLGVFEGSPLSKMVEKGTFIPPTEIEILEENRELIKNLDLQDVMYYNNHPTNTIKFVGKLPDQKDEMVSYIDECITKYGDALETKKRFSL